MLSTQSHHCFLLWAGKRTAENGHRALRVDDGCDAEFVIHVSRFTEPGKFQRRATLPRECFSSTRSPSRGRGEASHERPSIPFECHGVFSSSSLFVGDRSDAINFDQRISRKGSDGNSGTSRSAIREI